ncbi:MAG: hypothetical protein WAP99_06530 [Caldicoprobacterales bacterium]
MSVQYVKQFNADAGELSLNFGDKYWKRIPATRISSIEKSEGIKKVLFISKPVERIEIHVNGEDKPFIIQEGAVKDDYSWIKDVLKSFAEKYKVSYNE